MVAQHGGAVKPKIHNLLKFLRFAKDKRERNSKIWAADTENEIVNFLQRRLAAFTFGAGCAILKPDRPVGRKSAPLCGTLQRRDSSQCGCATLLPLGGAQRVPPSSKAGPLFRMQAPLGLASLTRPRTSFGFTLSQKSTLSCLTATQAHFFALEVFQADGTCLPLGIDLKTIKKAKSRIIHKVPLYYIIFGIRRKQL